MLKIEYTSKFKKDYKQIIKRKYNIDLLYKVIEMLQNEIPLPENMREHTLTGDYSGYKECHIKPDWLLIYKTDKGVLILTLLRTGTHSDLF